jgi:hypothetical protein
VHCVLHGFLDSRCVQYIRFSVTKAETVGFVLKNGILSLCSVSSAMWNPKYVELLQYVYISFRDVKLIETVIL